MGGEPTRYIRQLRHIFQPQHYPNIQFYLKQYTLPTRGLFPSGLEIPMNPSLFEQLKNRFDARQGNAPFSYSSLTTYLSCPLKFYFQYVLQLREAEEVAEGIDDTEFGILAHQIIESLYHPMLGKPLSDSFFKELTQEKIKAAIDNCFEQYQPGILDNLVGMDLIKYRFLQEMIPKLIRSDAHLWQEEAFVIESMEDSKKYRNTLILTAAENEIPEDLHLSLTGNFDRLDRLSPTRVRIVDYKTGKVELNEGTAKSPKTLADYFAIAGKERYDKIIQGWMYAYLFHAQAPNQMAQVGFYSLRKPGEGLIYLHKAEPLTGADCTNYENQIRQLLQTIFTQPFTQTTYEEQTCQYCSFVEICNRKSKK